MFVLLQSLPESVSGIVFSVSEEGTTALCDLSFSLDFSSVQSAEVIVKNLRLLEQVIFL